MDTHITPIITIYIEYIIIKGFHAKIVGVRMDKLCLMQISRCLFIILLLIGGYIIIKQTIFYWYPLIIVYCLTTLCYPMVKFLMRRFLLPRLFASIVTVSFIFILLLLLIYWLTFEFFKSMSHLIPLVSQHFENLLLTVKSLFEHHVWQMYKSYLTIKQQQMIEEQFQQMIGQLGNMSVSVLQNIVFKMMKLLSVFPYSLMILLFVLLATILMTNDWPDIQRRLNQLMPQPINDARKEVMQHFKSLFLSYIQAQLIIASITALILWVGLIFLNIEHAFIIVLVTIIVDLLPVVGTGIIFVPWIIYLFFIGQYALTIKLSILYGFIVILRQIIEPKIVSAKIGIRPLTVLISLFLSIQVFGAIGLILAPFIIIFMHALYQANVHRQIWHFIKR